MAYAAMQHSGSGCASGTCGNAATGLVPAWAVFACFLVGSTLGTAGFDVYNDWPAPDADDKWMVQQLDGFGPFVAVQYHTPTHLKSIQ